MMMVFEAEHCSESDRATDTSAVQGMHEIAVSVSVYSLLSQVKHSVIPGSLENEPTPQFEHSEVPTEFEEVPFAHK